LAEQDGVVKRREPLSLSALAGTVRILPPLPGSIHELLSLNLRDRDLPERVHGVIDRDPAVAAYVVRIANSSAFRGQAPVNTLRGAINRVGAPRIVGYALQNAVHRVFDPYGGIGRQLGDVAKLEANLMFALASVWEPRHHLAPEVAYLHGLLHDIGHLVMALKLGKDLEQFDHRSIAADEVAQREGDAFGFDHQQAGRLLANHWQLPDDLTVVIASHHFPRELRYGQQDSTNLVMDMLGLTDRLSRLLATGSGDPAIANWLVMPEVQKLLGVLGGTADEVLQAVGSAVSGAERDHRMSTSADTPIPS
jgi:HD-like signal output (HDOD) protein